jgi:hypothetical protein
MKKIFLISILYVATIQVLQASDQSTFGNKSPIITGTNGAVTIHYNETKIYFNKKQQTYSNKNEMGSIVDVMKKQESQVVTPKPIYIETKKQQKSFPHAHSAPPCMASKVIAHQHRGLISHTHKYSCPSKSGVMH